VSPDAVLTSLKRTLNWYQGARVVMQSVNDAAGTIFTRDDQQTVLRVLQRAFDSARGQVAMMRQEPAAGQASPATAGGADRRERLQTDIQREQEEITRLRARVRSTGGEARRSAERDLAAATNRLELDRLRLDFVSRLQQFDSSLAGVDDDLAHQVQALQDAVPELRSGGTGPAPATAPTPGTAAGTRALFHRLLALQRSHRSLEQLTVDTNGLARSVDTELRTLEASARPIADRLRQLAREPAGNSATLAQGQQEFRELLERAKLLGAVILPLREEAALLHRYANDVQRWGRNVDREAGQVLQRLGLDLVGVVIALGVILVGAVVWRFATFRYVTDPYRRRLLMIARNIVALTAAALVLVFHFTSELAALVTALGFAAAGIAFALQNVILAVAGYFSMVSPNGIRVGDRVSLQGPFGYVHGEVIEIGFVRIRLRELAGEPPQPTGRIVVFPNSVVFTGTFFKHPTPEIRS
jgi:hypothetical protein